jgi:hypothetical protein
MNAQDKERRWVRLLARAWRRLRRVPPPAPESPLDVPLPVLVHVHSKQTRPAGPLEDGMVEIEQDDVVMHALAGVVQPDGTIADLPEDKLEWARRLSYRHLKREGCLAEFGIPVIAAYDGEEAG